MTSMPGTHATRSSRQGRRRRPPALLGLVLCLTIALLIPARLAAATPASASGGRTSHTATIAGEVLSAMDPISGAATVTVFNAHTGRVVRSGQTDSQGFYRIAGIPPGDVKIRATKAGLLPGWADGARSWSDARVFTLKAGRTYNQGWSPLFLYLDVLPPASLSGTVMGINDDQWGYGWDGPLGGVRVTVIDLVTGQREASTTTDALGAFTVNYLFGGDVKVRFSAPGWLPTTIDFSVQWSSPNTLASEVVLYSKPAIRGQVLANFDPIGYATVSVFDAHTGRLLRSVTTDADGNYRIDRLPVTQVKVRASKQGWIASWANGKHSWSSADVFTLTAGQTLSQGWDPLVLYLDLGLKS